MNIVLKMQGIDKSFAKVKALNQAGLNVYAGKVMALMGENGAGKSTLMKVLTGIYTADAGEIEYRSIPVRFKNPRDSQKAGIAIIHQELNLVGNLTIAENIFLGREFTNAWGGINWQKMYTEADKLLHRLGVSYPADRLCNTLSIGEQQMVEIAKALSFNAKVIIMDEPTDALTDTETMNLFKVIGELKEQGCGIVYISHRIEEIFAIGDDVTILRDGSLIGEHAIKDLDQDRLIAMMVGRPLNEQYPHLARKRGNERLVVKNLCASGIKNVSFSLDQGEIVGISGLMGSGRTELMKTLYGALSKMAGTVILDGMELDITTPEMALKSGIAYVSEDRKGDGLILGMSVKENMSLSSLDSISTFGHISSASERKIVDNFIRLFNIKTPSREQTIGYLSGGNQQKVAIAKALMTKPKVLILDEPTRGVDVGAKKEIYQLINDFKHEGLSVILVSSEMSEILGMSDRILVMNAGTISGEFDRSNATQEKLLTAALGKNLS